MIKQPEGRKTLQEAAFYLLSPTIEFIRFLLVGGLNTGFSYAAVHATFLSGVGLSYPVANLIALICGIFFSFYTQGKFVFQNTDRELFWRFVVVWGLIYLANISIIGVLVHAGLNAYAAGAVALVPVTCFPISCRGSLCLAEGQPSPIGLRQNRIKSMNGSVQATSPTRLGIVVPCFNEEEVLPETNKRLLALLDVMQEQNLVSQDSMVCYVDDGSADTTWALIESLALQDSRIHGIKLSGNRGHQNALMAGLFSVDTDAVVSIDADLQDDVSVIEDMVRHFRAGAEIVYGVRSARTTDTLFKRCTAVGYYRLLAQFGVKLVHNHADFRLMGRRAVDALKQYSEVNLFLRGIVPMIGYRTETVYYERAVRFAGESKYPFRKMLAFAIEGITSFSVVPLRLITMVGLFISLFSFAMILVVIYGRLFTENLIPGWASSVVPIYFLGGIQLLCLGIIGEYVAKIYIETKARPRYFIEKVL